MSAIGNLNSLGIITIAMVSEHASPMALIGGENAGGRNLYVDAISRHLADLGYSIDIFSRRDNAAQPEIVEWYPGVRLINIATGPAQHIPQNAIWPLMPDFTRQMLRFMLRNNARYDLLHGHSWMSGWAVSRLKQHLHIPAVQQFHANGMVKHQWQGHADTSPTERIAIERAVITAVDRVIVQCPAEYAELEEGYAAAPSQLCLIPPGADIRRFQPIDRAAARQAIGLPDDGIPTAVYVDRRLPRNDMRNLLHAARLLHDRGCPLRVLLVRDARNGSDPEISALDALQRQLGIADHVIICGLKHPDELRNYYCAGDMVVTTPWYEPFGLTALEAMACGRATIVSEAGRLTFSVIHGENGLHVPPRDPCALAAAISLLAEYPLLAERMGREARRRVEREFTWPLTARRTAALYQSIASGTQRDSSDGQAYAVGNRH